MQRLVIVSNRLPVTVEKRKGELMLKRSIGGVATGLGSYHETHESIWVGWAEVPVSRLEAEEKKRIAEQLAAQHSCVPVFLTENDIRGFYHGFSNRTLWPLFHYFTRYAEFDSSMWQAYERVNRKYRDAVLDVARSGDIIWINDYQLMLLPSMLREKLPGATIGFFLHIPWPTFEVFRALPWRRELLKGLLGSDLIGFHTYDYARYFDDAVNHLLGLEEQRGHVMFENRLVRVDAFPMGIDYERYAEGARSAKAEREAKHIERRGGGRKVVLSIDRLDYTKGIPERLRAFGKFLERHPEWHGRVEMVCVAVPSRTRVERYRQLKSEVDQLVGSINGTFGTMDWMPVRYMYRSLPFHTLCAMYAAADVALVTPLRDGMNLIAKEYVAARTNGDGVLVLSEMAGAARELGEAVLVNPYDQDEMIEGLSEALVMPEEEQRQHNEAMQKRLKRYTVQRWAEDYLGRLEQCKLEQLAGMEHNLDAWHREQLVKAYRKAKRRLLLLDYDGTLTPFASRPELAAPSKKLLETLEKLGSDKRNTLVVISGRRRETLDEWLGDLPVDLVAEHGVWIRRRGREWITIEPMTNDWMPNVRPTLEMFVDRTPGSFVEEKDYSLAWHYRRAESALGEARASEFREALAALVSELDLAMMDGNKVIEVKSARVDKGRAAHRWMQWGDLDFRMAIGDDRTDEDVFEVAPDTAWTIKIGQGPTSARYSVRHHDEILELLEGLAGVSAK
ncbi:MAG: bifunctional alpha,alpha-trehalose-phosphate synthase (UDP-forming)/trehalose-phosphatase [Coriobacteriia bacterium]|nr:bifunctional alpha,alpha-trehalose-phosphate synthase (UDP-forming)/trehalose-phosphatase [Coriobacteriia bacterium]